MRVVFNAPAHRRSPDDAATGLLLQSASLKQGADEFGQARCRFDAKTQCGVRRRRRKASSPLTGFAPALKAR
jgi:hypothetical protein